VLRFVRAYKFLGSTLLLPLAIALFFGSAPFPDWHWDRLWSPSTVLPDRIRNGRTQKQNYSLNVTNCPGLFPPLGASAIFYLFKTESLPLFSGSQAMRSIRSSRIGVDSQRNLILLGTHATHLEPIFLILPFGSLMKLLLGERPRLFPYSYFSLSIRTLTDHALCVTTAPNRLHVNIFDTSARQFVLPPEYFYSPKLTEPSSPERADLQFHYEASPFAFWITRRSDPYSVPIFDTRLTSLPPAPIPAFLRAGDDPSLGFDGFPLVFEDRYLQVKLFPFW
jgi:hypothetical protein